MNVQCILMTKIVVMQPYEYRSSDGPYCMTSFFKDNICFRNIFIWIDFFLNPNIELLYIN